MTERPLDDEVSDAIMQQLEDVIAMTTEDILVINDDEDNNTDEQEARATESQRSIAATTASSTMMIATQPYPPLTQVGIVVDHDRPYADYGHLGDIVMDDIKKQFGIANLQYVCIGQEIGLNFTEFGTFKSTTARGLKRWSTPTTHVSSPTLPVTTTGRRPAKETKDQKRDRIAKECLELARTSVENAMDHLQEQMPYEFSAHSTWHLSTFNYVHLRVKQMADELANHRKEYIWPSSFPDCTSALHVLFFLHTIYRKSKGDTVNKWLKYEFIRRKRARCLILIGPTGSGKTSFAFSLPGPVNYFKGRWRLNGWNENARYSVFDDIPWDEYEKRNFPDKKNLLTQNGLTNVRVATDKYSRTVEINITQPAIVLLNPDRDAGVLGREPRNDEEKKEMTYWNERALIYRMGPDEYFYKEERRYSQIHTPEDRIGDPNEFEQMVQQYQQKHHK
ncbi:unnamed protein product [Rotaria sordida]|uniref:Replication-associated protein n=1 Tax=Rotaria sordida TaxID=392033 RepID=A0A815JK94_9BILA|nr:unnamed protein product [Rotaria sordida]CAF3959565.1 unnamed protein product [Rotaria sordida]